MKTVKRSPFQSRFDFEKVGLTQEFFDLYVKDRLYAYELAIRSAMANYGVVGKELIPDPVADFLGECRKNHHLVEDDHMENPGKVWQDMVEMGYIRKDFDWRKTVEAIMEAVAPGFQNEYIRYVGVRSSEWSDPIDLFIDRHYKKLSSPVEIDQKILSAEIAKLLPPDQAAVLEWIRLAGARYEYGKVVKYTHMALEEYINEDGQTIDCKSLVYDLSEREQQTVKALYSNLCQLLQRTEFQRILERAVS